MRGAIVYYSGTGNTALACQYAARRLSVPFELIDATMARDIDIRHKTAGRPSAMPWQ